MAHRQMARVVIRTVEDVAVVADGAAALAVQYHQLTSLGDGEQGVGPALVIFDVDVVAVEVQILLACDGHAQLVIFGIFHVGIQPDGPGDGFFLDILFQLIIARLAAGGDVAPNGPVDVIRQIGEEGILCLKSVLRDIDARHAVRVLQAHGISV